VHPAARLQSCRNNCIHFPERPGVSDTDFLGPLGYRWQIAHPYDVVDSQFIAEYYLRALIQINHCRKVGLIKAKQIEKSTVLPKWESIVGIIHRTFPIAQQQDQTRVQFLSQRLSTGGVGSS